MTALKEIIIFALWRRMVGECPGTTSYDRKLWRAAAATYYQHDHVFKHEVDTIVDAALHAAAEIYGRRPT